MKCLFFLTVLLLAGCASWETKQETATEEERAELRAFRMMHMREFERPR